jgi:hypothetical protein
MDDSPHRNKEDCIAGNGVDRGGAREIPGEMRGFFPFNCAQGQDDNSFCSMNDNSLWSMAVPKMP